MEGCLEADRLLTLFLEKDLADYQHAQKLLREKQLSPLLVHVHIPKCAGTSFNHLLDRTFGAGHCPIYSTSPSSSFSVEELEERVRAVPQAAAISSHSIRLFPRIIADRFPLYVLFLRDPVEWQISNLTYLIANYHRLSDDHRKTLPEDCARMSIKELVLWLREQNIRKGRPQTDVVNFLTMPLATQHGLSLDDTSALSFAKVLLSRCFFVGLVDEMPLAMERLSEKLSSIGMPFLSSTGLPMLNTSYQSRGDLGWLNEQDQLGKRVIDRLARDRAIYEFVKRNYSVRSDSGTNK